MDSSAQTAPNVQDLIVKEGGDSLMMQGIESLVLAIVILGVLVVVINFLLKRSGKGGFVSAEQDPIKVVYAKKVSRKTTALVIDWQGKEYLVLEAGQGVTLVDQSEQVKKQES